MKRLSESVWSNIQSRSTGDSVRIEDDINTLSVEEFKEYLEKEYNFNSIYVYYNSHLSIKVFEYQQYDRFIFLNLDIKNGDKSIFLSIQKFKEFKKNCSSLLKELDDTFSINIGSIYTNIAPMYIKPKDGEDVTNKFFIKVLEFLLNTPTVDKKILHKEFMKK